MSRLAQATLTALRHEAPTEPACATIDRVPPSAWPAADDPCWTLVAAPRHEVEKLYDQLEGFLCFPGLRCFMAARAGLEEWPMPRIIAYCASPDDVRTALAWARSRDWLISIRSGGHNNAGYHLCNGMVLDLSGMTTVTVDGSLVTAQAGVDFDTLSTALEHTGGLLVPGGTCPTVCVAGFTLGGGYSLASRTYGMCCDTVHSVRMMTADGALVVASETQNPELFWALRGGSGGQFGVLIDITYNAVRQPEFWGFVAQWSLEDAVHVLDYLERHDTWSVNNVPQKFGYLGALSYLVEASDPNQVEKQCSMAVLGMYAGTRAEGEKALEGLLSIGNVTMRYDKVSSYSVINTDLFLVLPYGALNLDAAQTMSSSGLVAPASRPDWARLVEVARKMPNPGNLIAIEPYGGAIAARPDSYNAFPHRGMKLDMMMDSFWNPTWEYNKDRESAQTWLDESLAVLAPALSGRVYVNYAETDLVDYRRSYWAQHFGLLLGVRQTLDPAQTLRFDQSISWYPSAPVPPASGNPIVRIIPEPD